MTLRALQVEYKLVNGNIILENVVTKENIVTNRRTNQLTVFDTPLITPFSLTMLIAMPEY